MGNASEEAQDKETRKAIDRRKLLGLAAAAAAGLAVTSLTGRAQAATGEYLIIGQDNEASIGDSTGLRGNIDWEVEFPFSAVLRVENEGTGMGVYGSGAKEGVHGDSHQGAGVGVFGGAETGIGVVGESFGPGVGVRGLSKEGVGVWAESPEGIALQVEGKSQCSADVVAHAPDEFPVTFHVLNEGIYDPGTGLDWIHPPVALAAYCPKGFAVHAYGGEYGVHGKSDSGFGVWGWSNDGIGVQGISENGFALKVEGRSSFSTVGSGTIPRGRKSFAVDVEPGLVTEESHVSVTLTSDPNVIGRDAAVSFIERDPANNRFIINLTRRVGRDTTFTYFIVEP